MPKFLFITTCAFAILVLLLRRGFSWRWFVRHQQINEYDRTHPTDEGIELGSYYHV